MFQAKLKKKYDYVLPDDQKTLVETLTHLTEQHDAEFKILDVTQAGFFHRLLLRLGQIKNFPVIENSQGDRLETPFSQSEVERFVSKSVR